jgi:hypothetical protein
VRRLNGRPGIVLECTPSFYEGVLGFSVGGWNQSYLFDTLPVALASAEELEVRGRVLRGATGDLLQDRLVGRDRDSWRGLGCRDSSKEDSEGPRSCRSSRCTSGMRESLLTRPGFGPERI